MKVELIRYKFNGTYSYKYKPYKKCCKSIEKKKCIVFSNEDIQFDPEYDEFDSEISDVDRDTDIYDDRYEIPKFCISVEKSETSWEDTFDWTENYPIKYCPFCGEKIEISVIKEKDVSDEYEQTEKDMVECRKKISSTDSKKKSAEFRKKYEELNKKINAFYYFNECTDGDI